MSNHISELTQEVHALPNHSSNPDPQMIIVLEKLSQITLQVPIKNKQKRFNKLPSKRKKALN